MGYSDVTPSDPAAGAGFTITTDANNSQRLVAVEFNFITNATALNRVIVLTWQTAAGVFLYDLDVPFYQTASKTWTYSGAIDGPRSEEISINSRALLALPNIPLPPASTITVSATMNAADQFSTIGYLLQDVSKQYGGA